MKIFPLNILLTIGVLLAPVTFLAGVAVQKNGASIGIGVFVSAMVGIAYVASCFWLISKSTLSIVEEVEHERGEAVFIAADH